MGEERGARAARARALAVLRVRGRALAVALLPAAVAVVLLAGGLAGHLVGDGWDTARWVAGVLAVVVLLAAAAVALVISRARPALSPTVELSEESAPDLYRLVHDLAGRLGVPAPSAIALTPDCDSWLEDRTHPAHGARGTPGPPGARRTDTAPVLVIGSPFLWWMRVAELRAVLAPVVAGTGPSAHPDIAAARRFVRGLDAAVAVADRPGLDPVRRRGARLVGGVVRVLLRSCREQAAEMERGVAAAASERAQTVDYGLRIVAQEQVGLAYAGWDRLLTRVALPAWRMGRWPSRLDAGVVAALTELSRRDRLAEGFTSRLGERPACDLLEEPGLVDEAASLLAARLFHGGPAETGPGWAPVDWQEYPEEVVDRKWRTEAARLHRVLDRLGVRRGADATLARVMDHLAGTPRGDTLAAAISAEVAREEAGLVVVTPPGTGPVTPRAAAPGAPEPSPRAGGTAPVADPAGPAAAPMAGTEAPAAGEVPARTPTGAAPERGAVPGHGSGAGPVSGPPAGATGQRPAPAISATGATPEAASGGGAGTAPTTAAAGTGGAAPAPGTAPVPGAAPEAASTPAPGTVSAAPGAGPPPGTGAPAGSGTAPGPGTPAAAPPVPAPTSGPADDDPLPLFPLQPPRTGRELLADHVTAMVCCAAVDTAGAAPGLDWLDGPTLLVDGKRHPDLGSRVLSLIEDADPEPLRSWLAAVGVRAEKPVRLA
ncbi:hypothetical protein [Streptomyces sp. NPDC050856]|uniref:hypothetical protein n=1 Tax=Streptomyces sp. NPDC050856 TaxID=3154939 RepID=UPI0033EE1206